MSIEGGTGGPESGPVQDELAGAFKLEAGESIEDRRVERTLEAEERYYRVSSSEGNPESPWLVNESTMARFVDDDGAFDESSWRAWASVHGGFQGEAQVLHEVTLPAGTAYEAYEGRAAGQDWPQAGEGNPSLGLLPESDRDANVTYMGGSEQVYLLQATPPEDATIAVRSMDIDGETGRAALERIAAAHPDQQGKLGT